MKNRWQRKSPLVCSHAEPTSAQLRFPLKQEPSDRDRTTMHSGRCPNFDFDPWQYFRNHRQIRCCSCANQVASRHRGTTIHDHHYRCCHYLEGREREQRRDQSSGWRIGKRLCASARQRTSTCRSRHADPLAQVNTGRTLDAVGTRGYHRCGSR